MNLDAVPVWIIFIGTIVLVMVFLEVGYLLGSIAHKKSADKEEAAVSGVSGIVLGLAAFIMAFSFAIVTDRHDTRKALVRDDADAIRAVYLRARFLPESDRDESRNLLRQYLQTRLVVAQSGNVGQQEMGRVLAEAGMTQRRLWEIAAVNAEGDMNSDLAALYLESLNHMMDVHASRLAIGVRMRVPIGIWIVLYGLTLLGMISMGYYAGLVASKRSSATLILAIAFSMVITLIAALDRPWGISAVTQQPLADLQQFISSEK